MTPEEAARPLKPSELGANKGLWGMLSSVGPEKTESTPFTGEPARTTLTEPPSGYQTPSPAHAYGVSPTKHRPQAAKQEDRSIGTAR